MRTMMVVLVGSNRRSFGKMKATLDDTSGKRPNELWQL